jgi:hypothetical protein
LIEVSIALWLFYIFEPLVTCLLYLQRRANANGTSPTLEQVNGELNANLSTSQTHSVLAISLTT